MLCMKPKDLPHFYSFEDRRPLIRDGVLCVPRFYQEHHTFTMPDWHREIFQNNHPIHLEFCSGNGEWIAKCAIEHPEINWIAVERKFTRVQKIWAKQQNHHLTNLFIICGNGEDAVDHYLPKGLLDAIYINFPDPWPKARHTKHRLLQAPFIEGMAKVIKPAAFCTLVTDDQPYVNFALKEFLQEGSFFPKNPAPHFIDQPGDYGSSYFNRLWKEMGRTIHYLQMIKREDT